MNTVNYEFFAAADRSSDDHTTSEADVLTEHTGTGNAHFSRVENTSLSTEDRTALKHVATIIAMLLGIALVLGLIATTA
jgi:hypothetical protein